MIIFALIISISCNENKIEEFKLVSGDIKYGPGSNFTFVDDLDNNAYSEVIYVSNEDSLFLKVVKEYKVAQKS